MASDKQWEIWYKENCKYDFEKKIYLECDKEDEEERQRALQED
jgi:hypothetical protein